MALQQCSQNQPVAMSGRRIKLSLRSSLFSRLSSRWGSPSTHRLLWSMFGLVWMPANSSSLKLAQTGCRPGPESEVQARAGRRARWRPAASRTTKRQLDWRQYRRGGPGRLGHQPGSLRPDSCPLLRAGGSAGGPGPGGLALPGSRFKFRALQMINFA